MTSDVGHFFSYTYLLFNFVSEMSLPVFYFSIFWLFYLFIFFTVEFWEFFQFLVLVLCGVRSLQIFSCGL